VQSPALQDRVRHRCRLEAWRSRRAAAGVLSGRAPQRQGTGAQIFGPASTTAGRGMHGPAAAWPGISVAYSCALRRLASSRGGARRDRVGEIQTGVTPSTLTSISARTTVRILN